MASTHRCYVVSSAAAAGQFTGQNGRGRRYGWGEAGVKAAGQEYTQLYLFNLLDKICYNFYEYIFNYEENLVKYNNV